MLRFEDISLAFGGRPVVDGLDFEVNAGEVIVVLGRSGCGKSTALRLAAGLLQPGRGRLLNTFARTVCVFQEPRLLPWMSARDNAAFGLKALGVPRSQRQSRATALLRQFGLDGDDCEKYPGALSGGMAQRVAIARALAIEPQLVLMDEPFGALDAGLRREMQDIVRRAVSAAGVGVLFVTHDVTEAVRLADRIVVFSSSPAKVVADLANTPPANPALVYEAAAALLRHPIIASSVCDV